MHPYKILTWTADQGAIVTHLGIDLVQLWLYAPYHQMIVSLQYGAEDVLLFLCLAALTLLLLGTDPDPRQLALLAGLFLLPYWALMAGGVPLPASVLPAQFAAVQVKALPVIALLPLALAFFLLRGHSRGELALVLLLMALLMIGHPLLELIEDEEPRKAAQEAAQNGLIAYACCLALFTAARNIVLQIRTKREAGIVQNEL